MAEKNVMFVAGFGYSAQALAKRLLARGWRVIGTTRSEERAAAMAKTGAEPVIWPPDPALIREATHLLISTGPTEAGDPALSALGPAISEHAPHLRWVGYLSTTGVYGDRRGGWVDEESPLDPSTRRGEMRKTAEAAWRALPLPLHIFRLAGIYGPGRGPFEKIRRGTARRIVKKDQVFSRIHRDDIAATLLASIDQPHPGMAYNLCDDHPAPPEDVIAYAATLLGAPMPPEIPFEEAELSPMARSFYAESKRVSNRRIKETLGVTLAYPSYREGLAATLAEEKALSQSD